MPFRPPFFKIDVHVYQFHTCVYFNFFLKKHDTMYDYNCVITSIYNRKSTKVNRRAGNTENNGGDPTTERKRALWEVTASDG